jgi:release factor glutamine methyltransferase
VETRFAGLALRTAPERVMVPRAVSEELVERAAALIGDRPARAADVGTGSGAIAVALAVRAPRAEVWATDVNPDAVRLARENARRHGVADRVRPVVGDLLEGAPGGLDLVVANLPYVSDSLAADPGYEQFAVEPRRSVFAPGDGLEPYRELFAQARERLRPAGWVVVQFYGRALEAPRERLDALRARLERRLARELGDRR